MKQTIVTDISRARAELARLDDAVSEAVADVDRLEAELEQARGRAAVLRWDRDVARQKLRVLVKEFNGK